MTSPEEFRTFADAGIDTVLIDAGYEFAVIQADRKAWYPKVKCLGWDFGYGYLPDWLTVVRPADQPVARRSGGLLTWEPKCCRIARCL